jgi:ATP-binding cassette, subfamily A (ABC1), member 3
MANGKLRCLGSAQHLKNKFGQGYQVEMKCDLVNVDDDDYKTILETIAASKGIPADSSRENWYYNFEETKAALYALTNDNRLVDMLSSHHEIGFTIWRDASSPTGVPLEALAAFATTEIRMYHMTCFLQTNFPDHILRERQDLKARYELSANNTRISDIFLRIEENKQHLHLSDYGVSQTSLEQVFNMHAAEAELAKQGRND